MATLNVHAHSLAITDIIYLINGHFYGEDKRDITVVLDHEDMLEFLKTANCSLYEEVSIETTGEYFYVTSSVQGSFLIVENARNEEGYINHHEGDILILPHYVPQEVKDACIDGSEVVIELALESIYDKLVEIIEG